MRGNVFLLVVMANVCLTFGNALLGKKYGHLHTISIVALLWSGKMLVGLIAYGGFRKVNVTDLPWMEIIGVVLIGVVLGFGELFLFAGLSKNTEVVAALGCLYPILLTFFAWTLTQETPDPRMLGAIALSAIAIYLSYTAS